MLYASAFIGISGGHVPLLVKIPRPRVYLPKIEINRVSHSHGQRAHVIVRGDGGYYSATHTSSRLRNESETIQLSFLFYLLSNIRRGFRQAFPIVVRGVRCPKRLSSDNFYPQLIGRY